MTLRLSRRPHYAGLTEVDHYAVVYDILTDAGDHVGRVHHNGDGWQLRWAISCPYCGTECGDRHLGVARRNLRRTSRERGAHVHTDIEARLLAAIRAHADQTSGRHTADWHYSPAMYARATHLGGSSRDRRRTLRAAERAARRISAALIIPEPTP